MRAFIDAISSREVPGLPGMTWLAAYEGPILRRDIAFAVALACFIVLAWSIVIVAWPADRLDGWPARLAWVFAALGGAYGIADVAEDMKLRRIFRQARTAPALDDADVTAANALTRIKLATIGASVIGAITFVVLLLIDRLAFGRATR
jgi:hypothetical protein